MGRFLDDDDDQAPAAAAPRPRKSIAAAQEEMKKDVLELPPFDRAAAVARVKDDIANGRVPAQDMKNALMNLQELENAPATTGRFIDESKTETPFGSPSPAAIAASGAALGAAFGAGRRPGAETDFLMRRMEQQYGLPSGSLAITERFRNPNAPVSLSEAARLTAQQLTPPAAPPVAAPAPRVAPEAALPGMQRWANAQTGPASQLAPGVVSELTSTYAGDPSGAPQAIERQAERTRLARQIVPTSAQQVSPGGIIFTESPRAQREQLLGITPQQRAEAMDRAMAASREPREALAVTPSGPRVQDVQRAASRSGAMQRGAMGLQGGLAGAGLAAQAANIAKNPQPADWQTWLSLAGNALGTAGAASSKMPQPMVRGIPLLGPLSALAQIPYAVKNREAIMRALTMGDVMPPGIATGVEASEPAMPR